MNKEWFVVVAGEQYGPLSQEELILSLQQKRASATDMFWKQGMPEWVALTEIPELNALLGAIPPDTAILPPLLRKPEGESELLGKKIAAGILGILLGGLGIHKFVLGYQKEGIIMLLVSILGVFLVLPTIAMGIIGLVEGIMYLCASDEEFVRLHKDHSHGWF